ncbi:hypothetical protein EDB84DRAFT_1499098, partial [Lactarius hengduanensis]
MALGTSKTKVSQNHCFRSHYISPSPHTSTGPQTPYTPPCSLRVDGGQIAVVLTVIINWMTLPTRRASALSLNLIAGGILTLMLLMHPRRCQCMSSAGSKKGCQELFIGMYTLHMVYPVGLKRRLGTLRTSVHFVFGHGPCHGPSDRGTGSTV